MGQESGDSLPLFLSWRPLVRSGRCFAKILRLTHASEMLKSRGIGVLSLLRNPARKRARSSAGQSIWLRTRGPGVRISPGAPYMKKRARFRALFFFAWCRGRQVRTPGGSRPGVRRSRKARRTIKKVLLPAGNSPKDCSISPGAPYMKKMARNRALFFYLTNL